MRPLINILLLCLPGIFPMPTLQKEAPKASRQGSPNQTHAHRSPGLPPGAPMVWEDRGGLTPSKVYWGPASASSDPLARLPAPPFSHFEKDIKREARSPKAHLTDRKGVKWTAKF